MTDWFEDVSSSEDDNALEHFYEKILIYSNLKFARCLKRLFYIKEILSQYFLQDLLIHFPKILKNLYDLTPFFGEYNVTRDPTWVLTVKEYRSIEKSS